jgi:dolichol-phosphate mannosyltransferase
MRFFVGAELHDFSCLVKVVRRAVLEETDLYGNMFRFLPVLAADKGFRVKEVPVQHLQERGKIGFYSVSDYITRLIDILTVFFNTRFTRKPLRFFSAIGIVFIFFGSLSLLLLFIERFFFSIPIGNRPLLFLSLLLTILGVLISSAGLLGEIIAFTNGRKKREYTIEKTI